jgi:hypothetical protein
LSSFTDINIDCSGTRAVTLIFDVFRRVEKRPQSERGTQEEDKRWIESLLAAARKGGFTLGCAMEAHQEMQVDITTPLS